MKLNNITKKIYNDLNNFIIWIEKNILTKYPYISYVFGSFLIIKFFPQYSTIPVLLIIDRISRVIIFETNTNIDIDSPINQYFLFNGFKTLIVKLLTGLNFNNLFINNFLLQLYGKSLICKI